MKKKKNIIRREIVGPLRFSEIYKLPHRGSSSFVIDLAVTRALVNCRGGPIPICASNFSF